MPVNKLSFRDSQKSHELWRHINRFETDKKRQEINDRLAEIIRRRTPQQSSGAGGILITLAIASLVNVRNTSNNQTPDNVTPSSSENASANALQNTATAVPDKMENIVNVEPESLFLTALSGVSGFIDQLDKHIPSLFPFSLPAANAAALPVSTSVASVYPFKRNNEPRKNNLHSPGGEVRQVSDRKNMLHKFNKKINSVLSEYGVLPPNYGKNTPLIVTLNGAAEFVENNPGGVKILEDALSEVLDGIANKFDIKKENMPTFQENDFFNGWLEKNILGSDFESYLAKNIGANEITRDTTLNELEVKLSYEILSARLGYMATDQLKTLWGKFLHEKIPAFSVKGAEDIKIKKFEWAFVNTGASFLRMVGTGNSEITVDIASFFGKLVYTMFREDAMPKEIDVEKLFMLPALVHYANNHPELLKDIDPENNISIEKDAIIEFVKSYDNFISDNVIELFNKKMSGWKPRRKLAEEILAKFPDSVYKSVEQYMGGVKRFNGKVKDNHPYINPPDLDPLYEKLTRSVADAWEPLDKMLITSALTSLDADEMAFIHGAELRQTDVVLSKEFQSQSQFSPARGRGAGHQPFMKLPPVIKAKDNVDFFSADKGTERIYAVKRGESGYSIHRVDRDIDDYCFKGVMESCPIRNYEWKLDISKKAPLSLPHLVKVLAQKHRDKFNANLYESGYEKTGGQKFKEVMLSMVPFYDCAQNVKSRHYNEAAFSCSLDIISFLPLLGQLTNLSLRFSTSMAMALRQVVRSVASTAATDGITNGLFRQAIKRVGPQFLKSIMVPGQKELIDLATGLIRSIDPGIELGFSVSKLGGRMIIKTAEGFKELPDAIKTLVKNLETKLDSARHYPLPVINIDDKVKVSQKIIDTNHDLSKLCSGRFKRGLTELCASAPFENLDVSKTFTVTREGKTELAFFPALLKQINPERYEILQGLLSNAYRMSHSAVREISKMTNREIVTSFKKHTGIEISEIQAVTVKERVKDINRACVVFLSQSDKNVVMVSNAVAGDALAYYSDGIHSMFITDLVFEAINPPLAEHIIIHEASHATGTKDYFYLPKDLAFEDGESIIQYNKRISKNVMDFYKWHLINDANKQSWDSKVPGKHLMEELNLPLDSERSVVKMVLDIKIAAKEMSLSDMTINNADSLSFFIMALGTESKNTHLIDLDNYFEHANNRVKFPVLTKDH